MTKITTLSGRGVLTRVGRVAAIALAASLLGACVQQPKPLYSWEGYQPSVYAYLKDDGADYAVQAQALEKSIEKARASNTQLPPGFRAHLGMLYLKMGDGDKGLEQLQNEKATFPESTPFMDFLLRNANKTASASDAITPEAQSGAAGQPAAQSAEKSAAQPVAQPAAQPAEAAPAPETKKKGR